MYLCFIKTTKLNLKKMKAIKLNNETFKLEQEKGDYVFFINKKSKIECILKSKIEIIEVESLSINEVKNKTKKLNKSNFMKKEEFAKSKYSTMSKSDFENERQQDSFKSKSF